ncbi:hypothetical protein PR048_014597 [Dryococelus australis]|uniref:Uncharacterized protein n=1 Tax=Dryococelus australis TaxID=614101 RepID=A0ABQ9HEP6_9NEOP|nr:hypothetical protein PR048_014597 [Dryococelus australis]
MFYNVAVCSDLEIEEAPVETIPLEATTHSLNSPFGYHIENDVPNNDNNPTENEEIGNEEMYDKVDVANENTIENSEQVVNEDNTEHIVENQKLML